MKTKQKIVNHALMDRTQFEQCAQSVDGKVAATQKKRE